MGIACFYKRCREDEKYVMFKLKFIQNFNRYLQKLGGKILTIVVIYKKRFLNSNILRRNYYGLFIGRGKSLT